MWSIYFQPCKRLTATTIWLLGALMSEALAQVPAAPLSAMHVSCTGSDLNAGFMGKQTTYLVRARFLGNKGQAVANVIFTISHADGRNPVTIACNTLSLFMELRPGHYMATADMADGPTKTMDFVVVKSRRMKNVVFHFPTISTGVPKLIQPSNK